MIRNVPAAAKVTPRTTIRPGPVSADEARARDQLLVAVATSEFLENGFHGATLAKISKKARISKRTIYGMFKSKEELFIYVSTRDIPKMMSRVAAVLESGQPFRTVIRRVVELIMESIVDRQANALLKLAIAERDSFPVLAEAMYEHGFDIAKLLGEYLRAQSDKVDLSVTEGVRVAYHLVNMASAGYGSLLADADIVFGEEPGVWADSVTDQFISGFVGQYRSEAQI